MGKIDYGFSKKIINNQEQDIVNIDEIKKNYFTFEK